MTELRIAETKPSSGGKTAVGRLFVLELSGWKVLGSPELTPEVRLKLIAGLHAEVGSRSIPDLEAHRDEVLLGLLELRSEYQKPSALSQRTAQARRSRALS